MERLQKVIAHAGISSRRHAEELISAGRVKVNGQVVSTLGFKVSSEDKIQVDDQLINKEDHQYFLLYKPVKVLCTMKDDRRPIVSSLIKSSCRIYPVGRLDYMTDGLIILTNDGALAAKLTHPSSQIGKSYLVKTRHSLTHEDADRLSNGIELDGTMTKPAKVELHEHNFSTITIYEGRNRQVRKMYKEIGHEIITLTRTQIAFLTIDALKPGKYRRLSSTEVQRLYNL